MLQQVLWPLAALAAVFVAGLAVLRSRLPLGLLLIVSAIAATLAAGMGVPIRHVVEGSFVYFNVILIVVTGMIFLKILEDSGAVATISRSLVLRLHRHPLILLLAMVLLLLIPGVLTGVAVTSVLSIGVVMAPIMIAIGVPPLNTALILALISAISMVGPPTNLLAMIIAQGIFAPYEGFELPSVLLSVPLSLVVGLIVGGPHVRVRDRETVLAALPRTDNPRSALLAWLPLVVVIGLIILIRMFPRAIPDIGTPLVFLIGGAVGLFTAGKVNPIRSAKEALSGPALTVTAILVGAGVFVQLAALVGIRGLLVVSSLSLPSVLAYLAAAVSLVFGGGILSPFGSTSIFGVPFALFFMGKNQIIVITALSLIAAAGQLAPPAAIAGRFSAEIAGVDRYGPLFRKSIPWMLLLVLVGVLLIVFSEPVADVVEAIGSLGGVYGDVP